jgi:hypothetical protein
MKAINTLKVTLIASAFTALLAVPAQAEVRDPDSTDVIPFETAPRYVRVRSLSYAGSGCPQGSVSGRVQAGRDGMMVLFDEFVAEVGPGAPFSAKRKNCQLNIDLDYSSGWSYAVKSMNYNGYVSLERGVTASIQASLYFQGSASTATIRKSLTGPLDRNYVIRDSLGNSSAVWSPCGAQRSLNINTQILLSNSGNSRRSGLIAVSSDAGDLPGGVGNLTLMWKRCH